MSAGYAASDLAMAPDWLVRMWAHREYEGFKACGSHNPGAHHIGVECLKRGMVPDATREPPMKVQIVDFGRSAECANTAEK